MPRVRRGGPANIVPAGDRAIVIQVRCAASVVDQWRAAAEMVGQNLSEFMRAAADERAALTRSRF